MPQTRRISKNNTVVLREGDVITVVLHTTPVVRIDYKNKTVTYDNGGWVTATTVTRMNQASNEYNLPYRVGRSKGWMSWCNINTGLEGLFKGEGGNKVTLPL